MRMQPLRLVEFGDGRSCGATHISKTAHAHKDERVEPAIPARARDVSTVDLVVGGPVVPVSFARARVQFALEILCAAVVACIWRRRGGGVGWEIPGWFLVECFGWCWFGLRVEV
jgi:hypothetical protein